MPTHMGPSSTVMRRQCGPKHCTTLVSRAGAISRVAAVAGGSARLRSAIAMTGRPNPLTPLTPPATKNAAAMAARMPEPMPSDLAARLQPAERLGAQVEVAGELLLRDALEQVGVLAHEALHAP